MLQSTRIMKNHILEIIADNRPSLYLFGSVVLEDFKLGWSDIDILCLLQTKVTENQAGSLVNLRQTLLEKYPDNQYFRSFEGGFLTLDSFFHRTDDKVVYWGTSGQRITDNYSFDVFSTMELIDSGKLLYGEDIRNQLVYPSQENIIKAVRNHYETIRKYGANPGRSLYSAGWLLDISRCLYTLKTGKIIAKTAAGEWAISNSLVPNPTQLLKALEIRRNPIQYKNDLTVQDWCEALGPDIQEFADVLESELRKVKTY